jgi:hypothetical protein
MPINVASDIVIDAKTVLLDKIQKMSIDVWMGFAEKTTKYLDFSIASWWFRRHDQHAKSDPPHSRQQ